MRGEFLRQKDIKERLEKQLMEDEKQKGNYIMKLKLTGIEPMSYNNCFYHEIQTI